MRLVSAFLAGVLFGGGLLSATGLAFAAGLGLPRWALGYLKKRREKNFLKALPDAVDEPAECTGVSRCDRSVASGARLHDGGRSRRGVSGLLGCAPLAKVLAGIAL